MVRQRQLIYQGVGNSLGEGSSYQTKPWLGADCGLTIHLSEEGILQVSTKTIRLKGKNQEIISNHELYSCTDQSCDKSEYLHDHSRWQKTIKKKEGFETTLKILE